jgi:hypothetical protein
MWVLLLAMILVYLILIKSREHFLGFLPDAVTAIPEYPFVTTDVNQSRGYEIYSATPNTCPRTHPELQDGLCYTRCRESYNGRGPLCEAQSQGVGVGIPIELEPCPDGWHTEGLICREPIRNDCSLRGLFRECWGRLVGGNLKGRLDGGGICGNRNGPTRDHPDRVNGLCYRKCPADKPHRIPGMPYLCYAGGDLVYGRGVGLIPKLVTVLNRSYSF